MADNRDLSRLATNPTSAAAVNAFNDLASEIDAAFSATLPVPVTNTNTVTITRAQLKYVTRIKLTEGSPATTGTITVFVNNGNGESPEVDVPLGRFTIINATANSATFFLVGGSSPSGTDLIATGVGTAGGDAAALIDVLDDDVVSVGGGSGGGGTAAPVDSVFGRTGVVTAQSGDYNATQVSFTDPIAGSPPLDNVDEALIYLLNNIGGVAGGGGALSLLEEHTFVGEQEHIFDNLNLDQYSEVVVEVLEVTRSSSTDLFIQLSTDNGSTWLADYNDFANGLAATTYYPKLGPATTVISWNTTILHMGSAKQSTFESSGRDGTTLFHNGGQMGTGQIENALRVRCAGGAFMSGGVVRLWAR